MTEHTISFSLEEMKHIGSTIYRLYDNTLSLREVMDIFMKELGEQIYFDKRDFTFSTTTPIPIHTKCHPFSLPTGQIPKKSSISKVTSTLTTSFRYYRNPRKSRFETTIFFPKEESKPNIIGSLFRLPN